MSNFKNKALFTALTLATATTAQAGLVRADVDYQYYRDFGENKGLFRLNGDTPVNAKIVDKQGKSLGAVLEGIPMIDLAVGSRGDGIATLVDPQYVVSVQHNVGYQTVQFGDHSSNNLDSHHFDYQVTDRHLKAPGVSIGSWHRDDYHSPRLHKLVTEVAPIPIANETHIGAYLDKEKYPVFVRSGGGTQRALEQPGNVEKDVAGPYLFVTGGEMLDLIEVVADSATNIPGNSKQTLMRIKGFDDLHNHPLGIMQRRGDSGSGVFAWDAQAKRWVYAMSVQSSTPSQSFSIAHLGFMEENRQKAIAGEISATGKTLNWTPEGNTSTITGGDTPLTVGLYDPALLERDGEKNAQGVASSQWHRPRQNAGKTFTITGDDNVLKLTNNVNQGSGAIYFKGNTTVEGTTANTTWLGAGVSVDKDKTVTWKVHNPDQDRLSKIGEGTLLVQGSGKNMGSISVGDGTVILDQKADANNQKQAFDEVGIVSGRSTVVLNSSDQVNPDSIYFGFRGGRLDVNGNDLTFNRIQNADSGARIVNHNMSDSAKVTLNRTKNFSSSGDVPFETNRRNTHTPVGFYAAPRADGTTDYFVLKEGRRPNVSFPTGKTDGPSWIYLASGTKQDAIRAFLELKKNDPLVAKKDAFFGFLGETDNSKNGRLDVEYNPTLKDDLYILNGGSNLNGTLAVKNGTLMLSGTPVPHAYDHLNNKDVVKDDEWIDRHFTASNFQVTGGTLTTSRNVGSITGDINASEQGRVNLGVVNGETENCYRSDYSGVVHCSATAIADNLIVPVNVKGNATASDTAHIQIANSNIVGNVRASNQATITIKDNTTISDGVTLRDTAKLTFANSKNALTKVTGSRHSQVIMQAGSHWQLADNSTVGQLTGETGSQISLNSSKADTYQQLTVNGDLTGNLTFNMATDLAQGKADKLIVNGYANGNHQLAVQNTGNEAKVDELTLVELRHGAQEAQDVSFALAGGKKDVDAGSLRYTLETDASNRYFLYNPTKADELAKQRQAEAEKARQAEEQAKQALADAISAREKAEQDKQRAEEALKQALANSGTSSQSLLDAQRQLEEARRLADQAQAEKARAEAQLTQKELELTNANNAKAEAERLKTEADHQAQTARDERARLQTALNDANRAKETAEQAKKQADDARIVAEQQAETAQNEKIVAEAKQREAEAKQQEAENQRTTAQNALDTANQQKQALEQQLADAIALGNSDTASLREQLAKATTQISEKEQALTEANTAKAEAERQKETAEGEKQRAETALNQAKQQLEEANRAKDDANNRVTQAENQKQAVEQNLTTVQAQLTQAQADKQTAEQKAREAETAKAQAERVQKELEQAQASQAEALKTAQETARLAEQAKQQADDEAKRQADLAKQAEDEKNRQAELARLAEIEKNRQAELARQAEIAKQTAENQANADKLKAEQELAKLQSQKQQADDNLAKVQGDLTALQAEKTQLQTALGTVNAEKSKVQDDLVTALSEKQIAEDALKLAQQNGSADIAKLAQELANANAQVSQKMAELQNAINAQTNLQNELNDKNLALTQAQADKQTAEQTLNDVRTQLATAQAEKQASDLAKQNAENAQKLAEDEAKRQAELAKQAEDEKNRQAELARLADLAKTQAEQNLAQLQADKQKADDELQNALTAKNQAETEKNQAQNDLATALREKQIAEDALKLAQQNGSQNVADLQNQLANAQAEVREKQQALLDATKAQADAETAKQNAETAKNNAEQALNDVRNQLATAQSEKQASDLAKQNAEAEAKRQADLVKQAEMEKNRQAELARLADLAKQQAETAQKLAEDAKNQALNDLANAELTKTQAEQAKTQAETAQKLADTARENAEKALQTALTDKQTAETTKTKAESDLATALREKQLAEDTLKLAQQNGNQDVVDLQNQLAQANQAVKDKELALANAQTAKQNAENAQKLAEQERDNALATAQTAELAKNQAETTLANVRQQLDQANADKLKAEQDKQASDLAKQQANQVKDQALTDLATAQLARDRAEQAKTQAEQTLAQLQSQKQKADDNLAKVQGDLTALQAEKTQLQTALDTANAEKNKVQDDLATALREKQEVENALAIARQNGSNDVAKLQDDLAKANAQITQKTAELQNAITAQTNLQNELNDKNLALTQAQADKQTAEQALNDVRTQLATAQSEKQASDLAKQTAENAQKLAEDEAKRQAELAKQAEDEKNRQAELARLAEIEKNRQAELAKQAELDKQQAQADLAHQVDLAKQAQSAKQVAETLANNAQKAQDLAEQAKTQAELARQKAEEANLALRQANERLQNLADTNAQVLAQAQTHLQNAQKLADDRQAILTLTEQNLAQAQADLAKAQSQNGVIADQLAQAQALRTQAELAKQEAERATQEANQARLVAIDAQTKSDSEKEKALLALAQAEQLAKDKQALAEQAELARLALSEQLDQSLKQLEATQAQLVVADAKMKEAEAKQALAEAEATHLRTLSAQQDAELARIQDQHKKQAQIISQYANTALSEISAQVHHLHRVSDRIDDRLNTLDGKNSGLWATTDSEKTTHSSDLYRAYEQDSQLTQIGVDNTAQFGTGNLTLGGAISHLSHTATFDDNFKGEGTTLTGTMYGKWHTPSGLAITSDISAGQTNTQIEQTTASTAQRLQPSDIKRTVASVGVGISQTFNTGDKAGNLDLTAHAGVRRHHLGDANYAIIASDNSAVKVKQDDIGITSYQAGVTASKTIHTANGFGIRPSIGVSYRHSDSQATLDINDRPLTQRFDSELKGQVGLVVGKGDWEVNLAGEYGRGEERGDTSRALLGVNWKW